MRSTKKLRKIENLLGGMFFNQKTPFGAFAERSEQKTLFRPTLLYSVRYRFFRSFVYYNANSVATPNFKK